MCSFRRTASGVRLSTRSFRCMARGARLPAGFKFLVSGFQCAASRVRLPACDFRRAASGVRLPASGARLPARGLRRAASGARLQARGFQRAAAGARLLPAASVVPLASCALREAELMQFAKMAPTCSLGKIMQNCKLIMQSLCKVSPGMDGKCPDSRANRCI